MSDRLSGGFEPTMAPGPRRVRRFAIILVAAAALIAAYAYLAPRLFRSAHVPYEQAVASGRTAPAFDATTLAGEAVRFPQDYAGKLVLLDFWATWCGPCVAEVPTIRQVHERLGSRELVVLGVSLDEPFRVPAEKVRGFASSNAMVWPIVYVDSGGIAERYGVEAIPAKFLVDGDSGRIIAEGQALDAGRLVSTLERYVQEKASSPRSK